MIDECIVRTSGQVDLLNRILVDDKVSVDLHEIPALNFSFPNHQTTSIEMHSTIAGKVSSLASLCKIQKADIP